MNASPSWFTRRAVVLTIVVAAPHTAFGQSHAYTRVAVSMSQAGDGNLFAAPASRAPQADLVSSVGPILEAGYRSAPLHVAARYEMAAERYVRRTELNSNLARQEAAVTAGYLPTRRLRLDVDASDIKTQTPGEFNLASQLAVGRARGERVMIRSTASLQWSPVTQVIVGHVLERDELAGGVAATGNQARIGVEHHTGVRNIFRVDYERRRISFSQGLPETSHAITGGWVHGITERTRLELAAGPRVTEDAIRPELSALLRRRLWLGEVSVNYSRTQLTAIGERGTIDVQRVAANGSYRAARRVTLRGGPSFARNTRGDTHVPVYTLDAEALIEAARRLSIAATGRLGRQEGTFGGTREAIPYRSLAVKLVVRLAPGLTSTTN